MSRVVLAACAVLLLLAEARAQSDWKKEWEKTIEAAKKEGQVNVYIGGWETVLESGAFQKAYPEIKVTWVGGRAGEIAKRILAERRAGKFLADVSSEGIRSNYRVLHLAKSFDPIKPALLLPEVTDESLWYQGKHRYVDPEGQFVFRYVGTQQQGNVAYNTKLVNPKEIRFDLEPRRRQMERQNHRARRARPWAGERSDAFFLPPPGDRPELSSRSCSARWT